MPPHTHDTGRKGLSALPSAPFSELGRIHLFRDVPPDLMLILEGSLKRGIASANETILELGREDNFFSYFFFILRGQIKIVGYDEDARARPLNFLRKGEFFVDKAIHWGGQVATKAIAITDAELLVIPRQQLKLVAQQHPPFHERIRSLSDRIDFRNRMYSEDKYARSVLDFLIENELTQASRVKITQMDKCIECNTCYDSCEDRHGFQRLERGYAKFGVLDFAKSCITCFYPTCIPACPVDSVLYNAQKGEVEILDECIGCTACARACQYGAIRMHKVDEADRVFERFLDPAKKIKPKFIADKCNHCEGHDDMACISNCPTGAIIEVEARDLLENPRIFGAHEGSWERLPSLTDAGWLEKTLQRFYIFLIFAVTALLSWEVIALRRLPGLSLLLEAQSLGIIPNDFVLEFYRGSHYCNFLGNVGFTFIMVALLYPLRKAFPILFKYLGKKPLWLDLHNFCGILGTILIIFHTGFEFPLGPSTFGLITLIAVMVSGIFGRFLYSMIPRGVAGTELELRDIQQEDEGLTQKMQALLVDDPDAQDRVKAMIESLIHKPGETPSLFALLRSIIRSRWQLLRFQFRSTKEIRISRRQLKVFFEVLAEKIRLKRKVAFLAYSSALFTRWQNIHRPLAYVMLAIAVGHIIRNLLFFPNL